MYHANLAKRTPIPSTCHIATKFVSSTINAYPISPPETPPEAPETWGGPIQPRCNPQFRYFSSGCCVTAGRKHRVPRMGGCAPGTQHNATHRSTYSSTGKTIFPSLDPHCRSPPPSHIGLREPAQRKKS